MVSRTHLYYTAIYKINLDKQFWVRITVPLIINEYDLLLFSIL
jgi:hypothetical protein